MDKRELIKSLREKLNIKGCKVDSKGAGVVSLRKTFRDSIYQILFSYKKYSGEYVLAPYLTGWKSFDAVENILERHYDSVGIDQPLVTIYLISRRIEKIGEIAIRSDEDIDKVAPYLRELIEEDIMPFFQNYNALQDVYFQVLKYNNDYSKINKFLFSPQPIRRIIINRLCDNPNWQEYGQSVFDGFKKASTGPQAKIYQGYIKFLPSLLEELALIKPIC
ncbi:MAG: hypothetical protein J5I94_08110 [Phaeodactylibacter sp.]|nr:hypothetical protein [Phaeodactylibacter sp.]